MGMRNPAARNSAVIPAHVTTRTVKRFSGFVRRAVYSHGQHIGYTTSHLGLHTAEDAQHNTIQPPAEGHAGFEYLSNAVVAVATAAEERN